MKSQRRLRRDARRDADRRAANLPVPGTVNAAAHRERVRIGVDRDICTLVARECGVIADIQAREYLMRPQIKLPDTHGNGVEDRYRRAGERGLIGA